MTTLYKFKAGYTTLGFAAAPSSAPVATVVDTDADTKLADAQATTSLTNLAGYYEYEYSGADDLDLVCLFHTTDTGTDQQDLISYVVDKVYIADAKLDTIDGNVDDVEAILGTPANFMADVSALALEATLTSIKGAGWSDEDLVTIKSVIDSVLEDTGTTIPNEISALDTDSVLDAVVEDGYTVTEILRFIVSALAGKLSKADNGDGTYTLTFRDLADTLDRIIAIVNFPGGERTDVTLDES